MPGLVEHTHYHNVTIGSFPHYGFSWRKSAFFLNFHNRVYMEYPGQRISKYLWHTMILPVCHNLVFNLNFQSLSVISDDCRLSSMKGHSPVRQEPESSNWNQNWNCCCWILLECSQEFYPLYGKTTEAYLQAHWYRTLKWEHKWLGTWTFISSLDSNSWNTTWISYYKIKHYWK